MDYINKNSLKIIEVLNEGELYFNEIYEKSKIKSKNNLLKNLKILVENKILNIRENKSNTFYSLNYSNLTTLSLLDVISKMNFERLPFSVKKSVLEVIYFAVPRVAVLFGSYTKGNYKKNSDIDILLVDSINKKNNVKEINEKYGVFLSPIFLSPKEFDSGNESLAHILKTGFPLVGKEYFYDKRKV